MTTGPTTVPVDTTTMKDGLILTTGLPRRDIDTTFEPDSLQTEVPSSRGETDSEVPLNDDDRRFITGTRGRMSKGSLTITIKSMLLKQPCSSRFRVRLQTRCTDKYTY